MSYFRKMSLEEDKFIHSPSFSSGYFTHGYFINNVRPTIGYILNLGANNLKNIQVTIASLLISRLYYNYYRVHYNDL